MRPAAKTRVPKYCFYKSRGTAYVELNGKRVYIPGPYGSVESRQEYDRLIAEWMLGGRQLPSSSPPPLIQQTGSHTFLSPASTSITVAEVVSQFIVWAEQNYLPKNGRVNNQFHITCVAMRPLVKLFGTFPATEFGPKGFKLVREQFVVGGCSRKVANRYGSIIKRCFKWAASEEIAPGELWHRLAAVEGLKFGRTKAPDYPDVEPVDDAIVDATLPFLSEEVRAMVELQRYSGMRSGEVIIMRDKDIDRAGAVWRYRPSHHKTMHHGHTRTVSLGKRCQDIIKPFLRDDPEALLFSPSAAEQARRTKMHQDRKTPIGHGNRPGTNVADDAKWEAGEAYTNNSYRRAIERATDKAFKLPEHLRPRYVKPTGRKKKSRIETPAEWKARLTEEQLTEVKAWRQRHHWHPHQLRHSFATIVAEQFGDVAAQLSLGHKTLDITATYIKRNTAEADRVAAAVG